GVTAPHLRPAGDPRLDEVAPRPERDGLLQLGQELRPLGPGPDDRHVALQYVPELRQLVDPRPPQEATEPGRARVALLRPRRAAFLGVGPHRPELVDRE